MVFLHLIIEFYPGMNKSPQLRGLGLLQQSSACVTFRSAKTVSVDWL